MSDLHDARIEAAAKALFNESQGLDQDNEWDDPLPDDWRNEWKHVASEVLAAADAVVTVDEAALIREAKAEALEEAAEEFRVNTWLEVLKPAGGMPGLIRNANSVGEYLLARAAKHREGSDQ